jgi:hypothetical protein
MIEAILSLIGPVLFGVLHIPYPWAVSWAVACSAYWLWNNRQSITFARRNAYAAEAVPLAFSYFTTALLCLAISALFIGVHSVVYFLAVFLH